VTVTESPPPTPAAAVQKPKLADGVELIGEYEGSGYKEAPSMVRRPDGQVLQLPPLLYSLAAKADGQRDAAQIAAEVGAEIHRGLDAEQVEFLVEEKLRPLGVVAAADGTSPLQKKQDPFLAFRFRAGVISERTSNLVGAAFKPLFFAPVVLAVIAAFIAGDIWLFFSHGVAQALRQSITHPGLFLPLFAAVILTAGFHEIGHAAGCRYGGGHPGKMGCGLYLAFPAFYTDVTDSYRLGKKGRLRTDLGGVYFNIIIVLITVGAYLATGFEPLLLLAVIQHFEIAHQLLPVIRLDGYYIVADLTGVPDLFARIGPILASANPFRPNHEKVAVLKRWVRVAVTTWVLVVVPLLIFELLIVLIHLPRIIGTGWTEGTKLAHATGAAFNRGDALGGITDILQIIVLIIPLAGIVLMLASSGRRAAIGLWTKTAGRPVLRILGLLAAGAGAVLLGLAWIPSHNYRPIQPGEKGTLAQGVVAVTHLPGRDGPLYSQQVARRQAQQTQITTPPTNAGLTTTTLAARISKSSVAPTSTTVGRSGSTTTVVTGGTTVTTARAAVTSTTIKP
jgi:putative peptide zinc metalloprotease protein